MFSGTAFRLKLDNELFEQTTFETDFHTGASCCLPPPSSSSYFFSFSLHFAALTWGFFCFFACQASVRSGRIFQRLKLLALRNRGTRAPSHLKHFKPQPPPSHHLHSMHCDPVYVRCSAGTASSSGLAYHGAPKAPAKAPFSPRVAHDSADRPILRTSTIVIVRIGRIGRTLYQSLDIQVARSSWLS